MTTIGINFSGGHDSSAAVAVDGRVVFAIAEERITRQKQDAAFPINAIRACLDHVGKTPAEIDEWAVGWPPASASWWTDIKQELRGDLNDGLLSTIFYWIRARTTRKTSNFFAQHGLCAAPRVRHMEHHMAHALSVMPYLKEEKSLIFVLDGRGSKEATSVYLKTGGKLELVHRVDLPHSLGYFYGEITAFCGFKKNSDEWKIMGLAPFGENRYKLDDLFSFEGKDYKVARGILGLPTIKLENGHVMTRRKGEGDAISDTEVKDLARSAQDRYEKFLEGFVSYFIKKYGTNSIGMAGGVGLNCKANGFIARRLELSEFFIQPASADDGVAIGAALLPFYEKGGLKKGVFYPYLGLEYGDAEILSAIKKYKLPHRVLENVAADAAQELANGRLVGWYQGRDEFGPRALGNRSILSDPRDPQMKDKVNDVVKYRENWRPFAPSMLEEHAGEVLQNIKSSPYMILTDIVSEAWAEKIPAVVHVDRTLRPQTVNREMNPAYWALINEFYKITGVPVVMNTSFNLKGEPNVSSPTDAIRTFFTSGLEVLYMGRYKVSKGDLSGAAA